MRSSAGRTSATGSSAGATSDGASFEQAARGAEMLPRPQPQLGQHRAQLGRGVAGEHVGGLRAIALHQIGRQIELAARRMDRQRPQQSGDRIGDPGMPRRGRRSPDRGRQQRMRAASSISADEVCAA